MKKIATLIGSLLMVSGVNATVLNFDDIALNGNYDTISSVNATNYGGLNWDTSWYVGDTSVSTYQNSAHSGDQYASNGNNVNNLSVGDDTLFDFDGAWFGTPGAGHSNVADWINVTAFDAFDNIIGTTGNIAVSATMAWVDAGFMDVSYLDITRGGGWFTMDDFSINSTLVSVPAPASIAILALGLAGLRLSRKNNNV